MNYHQTADLLWVIGGIMIIVGLVVFFIGIWTYDETKIRTQIMFYAGIAVAGIGAIVGGISFLVQLG